MKELLIGIVIIVLVVGIIFLLHKYKKEYLGVVAYYVVIQAEQMYKSKEGQQKLEFAVQYVKDKLPWWIRWLVSINAIKKAIEYALSTLQGVFKGAKLKQFAVLNNIIKYGASPDHIAKLQTDVDTNGYVEGYIEGRTNLKGDSNIVAGVRARAKF